MEEAEELGEGTEGSQVIKLSEITFGEKKKNLSALQSAMAKGATVAQWELEICCKFRWGFYPKS